MNVHFQAFVQRARKIAQSKHVDWGTPIQLDGNIHKDYAWDLTQMAGATPPPTHWLKHLGLDPKTLKFINERRALDRKEPLSPDILSPGWQDLVKSAIIERVYITRNQPNSVISGIVRPLKVLATCCDGREPWQLSSDDVERAYNIATGAQKSGKLAEDILGAVRIIFDVNSLSDLCPISRISKKRVLRDRNTKKVRRELTERNESEKLPVEQAFWEIVRIIWTEQPRSYFDFQKFALLRVLIMCGFRGNEAARIPLDWKRWKEYTDIHGHNASSAGGIGRSLMLRHFAEKQRTVGVDSIALSETVQHIPSQFEQPVVELLEEVEAKTVPLRDRLRKQIETGRIFPEFEATQTIPITEFYTRLTGDPFVYIDDDRDRLIAEYRVNLDLTVFEKIAERQQILKQSGAPLNNGVRIYLGNKLGKGIDQQAPFRDELGFKRTANGRVRAKYASDTFMVGELEDFLLKAMPTKLSDVEPFWFSDGSELPISELMFLAPKRALIEERNDGICDVTRYAFIGRVALEDLVHSLQENTTLPSLFEKYGDSEESKSLNISSHQFRHLQNTELFRLGIADTIITKRFNRRSVAQSHVYDHRTLAEELAAIEVPASAEPLLTGKARDVFRMISAGKAKGPIVDEFKRIQAEEGDEAAYVFLATEADGLHTTPYGHCINSFTVEPCPKALECFNGCRHLSATGLPEHTENLKQLLQRYEKLLESMDNHPASDGAKKNMREHAETRFSAIERILATDPGQAVFPDGEDLAVPIKETFRGPFHDPKQ